jgi:hypothetical protein
MEKVWSERHLLCSVCIRDAFKGQCRDGVQVAAHLGVDRIGPQHQAGSDSLLTSATFMKLLSTRVNGMEEALTYLGVLHQLGEDGDRPCHDRL